MSGIKDQKQIDELRKRLYARNAGGEMVGRHSLNKPADKEAAPPIWHDVVAQERAVAHNPRTAPERQDVRVDMPHEEVYEETVEDTEEFVVDASPDKKSRRYRWWIVSVSSLILVAGIIFSTFYLILGNNEISGNKISISVSAPSSMGAGETIPITFTIDNQNTVPVISGTLIVEYPSGTRAADESNRNIFNERVPIERIEPNSQIDIPVQAVVFGEVDEEKEIKARLEYRVEGTNSVLERSIDPIAFRITSAPLVVRVDAVEVVSAGQEIDIILTVESNAPAPLANVLVSAELPNAFDYSDSTPSPVFGNNTWRISELPAGGSSTIVIRGAFVGEQDDEFSIPISAGVPRDDNQFILSAIYAATRADFKIEQPFINVAVDVNRQSGRVVTLPGSENTGIDIAIQNTLNVPVYDMYVEVKLSGNALDDDTVTVRDGFYDSFTDTVRFDVTTNDRLREISAGGRRDFRFTLDPRQISTAQVDFEISVYARRVSDPSASEQLLGTAARSVQYASVIRALSEVRHGGGPFVDSGPIPPVAEVETTYTINLFAVAGENDLVDTTLTTSLPGYVTWLDTYQGPGTVNFNSVNNELTWNIGSLSSSERAELNMQVQIRPSRSQIESTPVLVNTQHLRATDRFTGTVVRAERAVLNTELARELGFSDRNGQVRSEVADNNED